MTEFSVNLLLTVLSAPKLELDQTTQETLVRVSLGMHGSDAQILFSSQFVSLESESQPCPAACGVVVGAWGQASSATQWRHGYPQATCGYRALITEIHSLDLGW